MRVTEKGQVTIPKPIRDRLGIRPGSEVAFIERDGVVHVERAGAEPRPSREEMLRHIEAMRGTIDLGGMTTDEYIEMVRGPRDDLDPR